MSTGKSRMMVLGIGLGVMLVSGAGFLAFNDTERRTGAAQSAAVDANAPWRHLQTRITPLVSADILLRVERGLSEFEAQVTVAEAWNRLDYNLRLETGKLIQQAWAEILPKHARDRARVIIVNKQGRKIGGSRMLNVADIWIKK